MSTSGGSYNTLLVAPLPHKPKTSNVAVIPAFRGHLVRQSIYGQSVHAGPCIVDPVRNYVQWPSHKTPNPNMVNGAERPRGFTAEANGKGRGSLESQRHQSFGHSPVHFPRWTRSINVKVTTRVFVDYSINKRKSDKSVFSAKWGNEINCRLVLGVSVSFSGRLTSHLVHIQQVHTQHDPI